MGKSKLALVIIFIATFVMSGFSQEDKKESTPQEKTVTEQQKPGEKDLKPQEEKRPEKKKSTPLEEAQQKYGYDVIEIIRDTQRTLDRSINTLNVVATLIGILIGLIALIFTIAGATGFFQFRRWTALRKDIEEDAKYIREIRDRSEQEFNDMRNEIKKKDFPSLREEPTKELKEKLDEFSRKLEFFELLGMPLKPEDYVSRGNDLFYKNNFEFSLKAYDKATKLKPGYIDAWINKGVSLMKLDRDEEAIKAYEKAIELKPDNPIAWINKGITFRKLERFEEALKAYDKAIKLKPDYIDGWINKSLALMRLERFEEALKAEKKAIELKPDYDIAWYNKACLYSLKGDKENALQCLSRAIELDAKNKKEAKEDEDFKWLWKDEKFKKITS